MIIVKLQGGLGNQMFQYALGRNLSLIHKAPLKIDCSYLKVSNQSGRSFKLDGFQIETVEADEKEIQSYIGPLQKIMDKFRPNWQKRRVKESFDGFGGNVLKRSDGYFEGHWQNEKYFRANEDTIREDFSLNDPFRTKALEISEKIASTPNAVSVHIRRGDYVSIKKIADAHGALSLSYYETACHKILEKFPDACFFVFSDDIAWAEKNFPKKYPVTLVSSPEISDCEELILMSLCRHNIIANSTFSWWSAWLNQHANKIVIAPRVWKKNASEEQNPSLPNWFKL